jgi:hypothetical protein
MLVAPASRNFLEYLVMFRKSVLAAAGLCLGLLAAQAPAHAADATVKAGVLSCHVASGWGFVFGSSRDLRCTFTGNGKSAHYNGSISKFGIDVGYEESGVMVWAVLAPSLDLAPGALAGNYGGITAGATAGVGGSANLLVGGSNKSISLQPLSIEGDKGFNLAAGVAAISLKFVH